MAYVSYIFLVICVLISRGTCRRIVDLSYDLHHGTVLYPSYPRFNLTIAYSGPFQKAPWVEFGFVEFAEHTGTHVDLPVHFYQPGLQAHQVALEQLMGPGVVINVKDKVVANINYRITAQDLIDWEIEYGKIPKGSYVLMNSGWGERYPDFSRVFNSSDLNDTSTFYFPGFHENAAEWLVNNRVINGIGVDTPSSDYGQTDSFPVHQIMAKENLLMIENVANMDKLPANGSYIYVPIIKFRGGTGAPVRLFAVIEEEGNGDDQTNVGTVVSISVRFLMALLVFTALLSQHI